VAATDIVNPAQATAYLLGQLEIEPLKRQAQRRLARSFDAAAFHQRVLENGAVPLGFLDRWVDAWLDRATAALH
jgi:uncharacterized protein (DUF885 family)